MGFHESDDGFPPPVPLPKERLPGSVFCQDESKKVTTSGVCTTTTRRRIENFTFGKNLRRVTTTIVTEDFYYSQKTNELTIFDDNIDQSANIINQFNQPTKQKQEDQITEGGEGPLPITKLRRSHRLRNQTNAVILLSSNKKSGLPPPTNRPTKSSSSSASSTSSSQYYSHGEDHCKSLAAAKPDAGTEQEGGEEKEEKEEKGGRRSNTQKKVPRTIAFSRDWNDNQQEEDDENDGDSITSFLDDDQQESEPNEEEEETGGKGNGRKCHAPGSELSTARKRLKGGAVHNAQHSDDEEDDEKDADFHRRFVEGEPLEGCTRLQVVDANLELSKAFKRYVEYLCLCLFSPNLKYPFPGFGRKWHQNKKKSEEYFLGAIAKIENLIRTTQDQYSHGFVGEAKKECEKRAKLVVLDETLKLCGTCFHCHKSGGCVLVLNGTNYDSESLWRGDLLQWHVALPNEKYPWLGNKAFPGWADPIKANREAKEVDKEDYSYFLGRREQYKLDDSDVDDCLARYREHQKEYFKSHLDPETAEQIEAHNLVPGQRLIVGPQCAHSVKTLHQFQHYKYRLLKHIYHYVTKKWPELPRDRPHDVALMLKHSPETLEWMSEYEELVDRRPMCRTGSTLEAEAEANFASWCD